ncbi:hypothetical protein CDAR_441171 [Caerostris darwini]|uniref:Period n=1 Tax=Caerostris darwini TaxID=1538125 RepID=A0AAV4RIJ8_9ARAC|nr:hypothetical protein CDAR_441171 [Caerostris darwini]
MASSPHPTHLEFLLSDNHEQVTEIYEGVVVAVVPLLKLLISEKKRHDFQFSRYGRDLKIDSPVDWHVKLGFRFKEAYFQTRDADPVWARKGQNVLP